MNVLDERWLEVVDGTRRTPSNPKRKSVRHIWVRGGGDQELGARFLSGAKVSNSEIQSALVDLVRGEEEVG